MLSEYCSRVASVIWFDGHGGHVSTSGDLPRVEHSVGNKLEPECGCLELY